MPELIRDRAGWQSSLLGREEEWSKVAWEFEERSVLQMTHRYAGDTWNKVRKPYI